MKKRLLVGVLLVGTIALASCGINNLGKKEDPTSVIKELQGNLVDSLKSTALGKKNTEGDSNVNIKVSTPVGKGNLGMNMKFRSVGTTGDANLDFNGDFDIKVPESMSGTISGKLSMISTLSKMYLNLEDFNINSTNPKLMMYNSFIPMFKGKWFYIENDVQSQNITKVLSNISFKDELTKYSLFKVNKELEKYKYDVSLDKDNIAKIIYDISKKMDPNYSGNVEQIKGQLGSGDISGILSIEENKKYFTFSGNLINPESDNIPLEFKFTEKKFYISVANGNFTIDLDRDGDNFKGYALFKDGGSNSFKISIDGLLTSDRFDLGLVFDENGVLVNFQMKGNYKDIDKLDVTIPKDAVSLQELQSSFGK